MGRIILLHRADRCFRCGNGLGLLCLFDTQGSDGYVIDAVSLHIGCQRLAHFGGIGPALLRIRMNGLHNDLGQFIVCLSRRGKRLFRGFPLEGQAAVIVQLVQDHAEGVGVRGHVNRGHGIIQFRRCIGTVIFLRQCGIAQGIDFDEAEIADPVFFPVGKEYIGGLQIDIQGACLAAHGQCVAQIQAQVHSLQMCHGMMADITLQRALVAAQKVNLIAQPVAGNGLHLPGFVGQEAFQPGEFFQKLRFLHNIFALFPEVIHGAGRVLEGTGQQQGIHLHLRGGDGDDFDNIFFIGVFLYGGTTADAVVLADGITHGETVQQRGDEFGLRQSDRLL